MNHLSAQGQQQVLWFKEMLKKTEVIKKLRSVELLICDVDGSLTSGHLVMSDAGIESKCFSVVDGLGITTLRDCGLTCAIISKRTSPATNSRALSLGIPLELCLLGVQDKATALNEVLTLTGKQAERTLVWGDDIPDFELKKRGVILACPAQTPFYLQATADVVLPLEGGNHAVRLLSDLVLYVQKKHPYSKEIDALCR